MSHDSPRIPPIRLPQLGSPPEGPPVSESAGAVRSPDDHHDRFLRFISSGDGLDQLVEAVERDTIDTDGRTIAQRDDDAERARQDAIMSRDAVAAPLLAPRTPSSSFDDDTQLDDPSLAPWSTTGAQDGVGNSPGQETGSQSVPPTFGTSVEPDPIGLKADPGDSDSPRDRGAASDSTEVVTSAETLDSTAIPHIDDGDDGIAEDTGDADGQGGEPDGGDAGAGAELPPAGSLWESTRIQESDSYDPGDIVVDPPAPRAEPGRLSQWFQQIYESRWLPLSLFQKAVAAVVVAGLAVWSAVVMFSGDSAEGTEQVAAAPPIAYAPESDGKPRPGRLSPVDVKAPGCPARSQPPANAFDGKPDTAWVCIRAFNTDLQTITVTFAEPVVVCSIFVIPGFESVDENNRNRWNEHRVVSRIQWQIGGRPFRQDIDPNAHTGATISIPAVATQVITGTVFNTVPPPRIEGDNGPSDNDINATFAVSTITVNGFPAGGVSGAC